jgi:hypothetical protein
MQSGDISGTSAPRLIVVFEGIIGELDKVNREAWNNYAKQGQWRQAIRCWTINDLALAKLTYLCRNQSVNIEVATFAGPVEFADELEIYLVDEENVPIRKVLASTPARTARRATFAVDITTVYDTNPARVLTYGRKGRHITSIHDLGR